MNASEQERPDVKAARQEFAATAAGIDPARFIFFDETGAQTSMTRRYGRAHRSERCIDHAPAGHWHSCTLLSAIRISGPIEPATVLLDGPVNGAIFAQYIEDNLAPTLRPGDILVMDNLGAHKSERVRLAVEARGARLWYLPPYSPDLNPIEKLFSKLKAWLRRLRARSYEALVHAFDFALRAVAPDECRNYFKSCGYAA